MKIKKSFLKAIIYLFVFLNCIYIIFPIATRAFTEKISEEKVVDTEEIIEKEIEEKNKEIKNENSNYKISSEESKEENVPNSSIKVNEENVEQKEDNEKTNKQEIDKEEKTEIECCTKHEEINENNIENKINVYEKSKNELKRNGIPTAKPNANNIDVYMFCDSYITTNKHYGHAGFLSRHSDKWNLGEIIPCDWMEGYEYFCPLNMNIEKWVTFYNANYGSHMFSLFRHGYSRNDAIKNQIPFSELGFYWNGDDWEFYGGYLFIIMTEYSSPINYTVIHEYYTNDKFDGSVSEEISGNTGDKIYSINVGKKNIYMGNSYTYTRSQNNLLTLSDDETYNIITLRYDRETTYTVIYTDGVAGETVFPDEGYEGLKEGDKTPEFERGEPTREGYTFMGWAPSVNPIVKSSDCNENGEIIYKATWQKDQPKPIYADYKVEWYDINDNKLKTDEYRIGTIGNKVQVTDEDKAIEGYTFDAENEKNVLEETLKEDGSTVLKLYFIQDKNEIEEPNKPSEKNYKVEWYDINDNKLKTDEYRKGTIGNKVQVTENDKVISGYIFDAKNEKNILEETLEEDGSIVLKLYFIKEKNEIKEPNTPPNAESEKNYKVEWYDIYGNKLKETEIRTDIIGNIVEVTSGDKIIDGYTFIEYYKENNLSQELDKDGNVILKLHFKVEDEKLNSTNPEETDKKVSEINTGDNSRTTIYAILTMVSLIGIITILFLMKNKKIEGKYFK